jgi:hypothetical protein
VPVRVMTARVMPGMSERPKQIRDNSVLVIVANAAHRAALEQACQAVGRPVLAVGSVADIERWPEGQTVVTDAAHLTPWWRLVGAVEVIVLVRDEEEGVAALKHGATRWCNAR